MSMKQGELTKEIVTVNAVKIVYERETLGKTFRIYGTDEQSARENPLFLATEVASWIEHKDVTTMLRSVDEEEKVLRTLRNQNNTPLKQRGNPNMTFLTEEGLYEVLMQSRKPLAKQFKKQVKMILKEIRLTGSYSVKPLTATQMFIAAARALEEQDQRLSMVENGLGNVVTNVSSLTESVADINKRLSHEEQVNALTNHMLDIKDRKQQKQLNQHEEEIQQLKQDRFTVKEDISTDIKGFINKVFDHYPHFSEQGQKNGKAEVYRIFYGAVSEGAGHSSTYISTLISERRKRLISQGLSEATAKQKITGISVINSDPQLRTAAMGVIKNVEDIMKAETEGGTNA